MTAQTEVARVPAHEWMQRVSVARAHRDDAPGAVVAAFAADVHTVDALLWENGLGEAPDLADRLAAVGTAICASLADAAAAHPPGAGVRQTAEAARRALVAAFDPSVHALIEERLVPLDHLDSLVWPAGVAAGIRDARPFGAELARNPELLFCAADDTAVAARALHAQGHEDAADRMARQALLAAFEGRLALAAARCGDPDEVSVDLRWEAAALAEADTVQPWWGLADLLASVIGPAERDDLRRATADLGLW